MATINANIAAVRTAIFGKDVREAIADSVSQLYDKTQEFEDIVEELERENSVQEYANMSSFPNVGESNVIYVDKSANILYRWTGTAYAELSSTLRLGETSTTAFPGNRGLALETGISNLNTNIGTVPSGKTVEGQISELSGAIGTVPSGKTVEGQISELGTQVSAKQDAPEELGNPGHVLMLNSQREPMWQSNNDYLDLDNKPKIGGVTLNGNRTLSALGIAAKANTVLDNTISMGRKEDSVVGEYSAAFGDDCEASGSNSFATGWETEATNYCAFAEGNNTTASGSNSHAEGMYTTASGEASHAEGYNTTASGGKSHAEGTSTTASGAHSSAHGYWTKANGDCTSAFGRYNVDLTIYPAWESGTTYNVGDIVTIVNSGVVRGYRCNTQNSDTTFTSRNWDSIEWNSKEAFVIGNGESANSKSNAFEVHWDGTTKASGEVYANGKQLAHAEDVSAKADKENTVLNNTLSMGRKSTSIVGNKSTALGSSLTASGIYSFATGYGTKATGQSSHAGGEMSEANGAYSFAYGMGVIASGDSETVVGSYNKAGTAIPAWVAGTSYKVNDVVSRNGNSYRCIRANSSQSFDSQLDWKMSPFSTMEAFVVGNGGGTSYKSNAFEVRWDGTIKARRIILESPNGTPYMLSVADNGTLSTTQVTT